MYLLERRPLDRAVVFPRFSLCSVCKYRSCALLALNTVSYLCSQSKEIKSHDEVKTKGLIECRTTSVMNLATPVSGPLTQPWVELGCIGQSHRFFACGRSR